MYFYAKAMGKTVTVRSFTIFCWIITLKLIIILSSREKRTNLVEFFNPIKLTLNYFNLFLKKSLILARKSYLSHLTSYTYKKLNFPNENCFLCLILIIVRCFFFVFFSFYTIIYTQPTLVFHFFSGFLYCFRPYCHFFIFRL